MSSPQSPTAPASSATPGAVPGKRRQQRIPIIIAVGVAVVLLLGFLMVARASSHVNKVALASLPVGVTAVEARATSFNSTRHYVGTLRPWVEAKIGPQLISAYVGAVLVRPGDLVKRGQVIGTLDCRNASAASQGISMQAKAISAQQVALAHEAARITELQSGGFASANEIERKQADSASKEAELMSTKARLERATLEVSDCVLRSPFDGEISDRTMDPGAYVHPGQSLAVVIDRSTVRVETDVPEEDFDLVKPGVKVDVLALSIGRHVVGTIARRSPAADESTRTVHFEIDLQDPSRTLPVGTTAELTLAAGAPLPAMEIPLAAAAVRGSKATLFLADGGQAKKVVVNVLGERAGRLFVDTSLPDKALVITEGRTLLKEGETIQVSVDRLVGVAGGKK
jgi:RND family efflux transporter MFP subunit